MKPTTHGDACQVECQPQRTELLYGGAVRIGISNDKGLRQLEGLKKVSRILVEGGGIEQVKPPTRRRGLLVPSQDVTAGGIEKVVVANSRAGE
jgi:hypothetical protein